MTYSIVAEGLVKRFGVTRALDGIDLAVPTGSVFGLLGPNGAGRGLLVSGPAARPAVESLLWAAAFTIVFAPLAVRAFKRRVRGRRPACPA